MSARDHGTLRDPTEDALLLRELCHRTSGEVAAALAALRLVAGYEPPGPRHYLVEQAIWRLQGFGELNRLLGRAVRRRLDVAPCLSDVCVASGTGRSAAGASRIDLDLGCAWMEGSAARRLLLVAAELVANAIRQALQDRAGRLRVVLRADAGLVTLVVEDDGPGPRLLASDHDDLGRSLAVDLVGRSAGTITMVTGRRGTRVTVAVPTGFEEDDDDADFAF
jgi:two-component sensor histidine kinase